MSWDDARKKTLCKHIKGVCRCSKKHRERSFGMTTMARMPYALLESFGWFEYSANLEQPFPEHLLPQKQEGSVLIKQGGE